MGVLRAALVAALLGAGCYSPALRDCSLACESEDECAGNQVCGADHLCAAPEVAGKCRELQMGGPDGGLPADAISGPPRDAAMAADAMTPPPPDAMMGAMVQLNVRIDGKGNVDVMGAGMCASDGPQKGDCTFMVPAGMQRTARATGKGGEMFTRWTSIVCAAQGATCTFTPFLTTSISARFEKPNLAPTEIGE